MSASNLFDDIEDDDNIFSTPAKAPPKKKKQWMDDLLDDDKDLFGDLKTDKDSKPVASAPSKLEERETGTKTGGLFDDFALDEPEDKPADVNGHKDEEFVLVSHDEVPSPEEAEKMASYAATDNTAATERDSPEDELFNQNLSYEERARIRREQRRKKAEQKSSESPSPSSQPEQQDEASGAPEREKRSTSPSPSPGIVETSQATGPVAAALVEPEQEEKDLKMASSHSPTIEADRQSQEDPSQQIRELTESLERAQAENGSLKSDNKFLMQEVKSLKERVDQLEKQLAAKNKEVEDEAASHKKQIVDLEEKLKDKDKEIEELKAAKKTEVKHDHHRAPITTVSLRKTPASPSASPATSRTKLRSGVDKGRPITSVADSVKKFSGSGTTSEVKKATHTTAKPKPSSPAHVAKTEDKEKLSPARKPVTTLPPKPITSPKPPHKAIHHERPEPRHTKHHAHPPAHGHSHAHSPSHGHAHTPRKPEPPSKVVKVPHKKSHPHHAHPHHHHDRKEGEEHKKMDAKKKTDEVTITKMEPKAESKAVAPPPTEQEPPSEPKVETVVESDETEKKVEEEKASSPTDETSIKELERDTTRAQRVITLFEGKGNSTAEQEQPSWKVAQQQQRAEKERQEKEQETERQKEQEAEEKEKEKEADESRSSSNASSQKEPELAINGSIEDATDELESVETEFTDGAMISKPKNLSSSSNATKSTSALPLTNSRNDEVIHHDNKMKKAGSSTSNIMDPKKRLLVDDNKGKRSSWAAPKREDCAVCGKVVYVMERLEADKVVYHKTCFKCTVCNKTLSTGNYAALQGKTYCKVHFKQLFKMKGNYDEGFGREQHKTKWLKKDQLDGESEA